MRLAFPGLEIRNQNELKHVALKIFNQTFSSTRALIIIGLSVAFLGLALGPVFYLRRVEKHLEDSSLSWIQ